MTSPRTWLEANRQTLDLPPDWGGGVMACLHEDTWFDRSLCPDPCGYMHTYCVDCDAVLDPCALISSTAA